MIYHTHHKYKEPPVNEPVDGLKDVSAHGTSVRRYHTQKGVHLNVYVYVTPGCVCPQKLYHMWCMDMGVHQYVFAYAFPIFHEH